MPKAVKFCDAVSASNFDEWRLDDVTQATVVTGGLVYQVLSDYLHPAELVSLIRRIDMSEHDLQRLHQYSTEVYMLYEYESYI